MINLREALLAATVNWRRTAEKTRLVAGEVPHLLARGHMHGLSDGLDVAADEVDELLHASDKPLANGT